MFSSLMTDTYAVMVRDALNINCFDERDIELVALDDGLSMADFMLTPLADCNSDDAILELIIGETDVEYSIDGGNTW